MSYLGVSDGSYDKSGLPSSIVTNFIKACVFFIFKYGGFLAIISHNTIANEYTSAFNV